MIDPGVEVDPEFDGYARFTGLLTMAELERWFFFDDADVGLITRRRGDRNRLGFAVQLGTVRFLGTFLADPTDVPTDVIDYVAAQIGVTDPSCMKRYLDRRSTRFEHAAEISAVYGYQDFAVVEADLAAWIDDRVWTTGDGPKALFAGAYAWCRDRRVVLPGRSRLARLVIGVRDVATQRLWDTLADKVTSTQAARLEALIALADDARVSELERLRTGPTTPSVTAMIGALQRVVDVTGIGIGQIDLTGVPRRRIVELARWGMAGKASALRRHPRNRRLATLLATGQHLHARAVDDALELFDLLMTNDLMARARRAAKTDTLARYPQVSRDAAICAAAVNVLLAAGDVEMTIAEMWEQITAVVSRTELAAAVANIATVTPPPGADPGGEWRGALIERYRTVRRFLPQFVSTIRFAATPDAATVLDAFVGLPELITSRPTRRVPAGYLDADTIVAGVVPPGWWHSLAFSRDRPTGTVERAGYVFCVLEQFHQRLRSREIFAPDSSRWADPRAQLLTGTVWAAARGPILNALGLPDDPTGLLAEHATRLDTAWRHTAETIDPGQIADGRLHAEKLDAITEPASLSELRTRLEAMMPRVDIGDVLLDVMSWHPEFVTAFQPVSGGDSRLTDLDLSVAAALTAHALNIGYVPVISAGVNALTRNRISHVDQNYLRAETYAAANRPLITAQAAIPLAAHWGGGLVAAADGIRFAVPVRSIDTRPNPKYFGRGRGATLLNLVNDHRVQISGMVVSGTPRDSLHLIDLIYRQDAGTRPEVIITDTGSYSDVVFGLLHLLGFDYRPQLADLPDTKMWRTNPTADYGPLINPIARGVIDTTRIVQHWPDILRVVGSIHTGTVSAHDIIRILNRNGKPTRLGDAIAHYGRIFKTGHVLTFIDNDTYRRQIKQMRNLQEGRHDLARHVFHGQKGQLRQPYRQGMEDQLGALGLVLNCITLWNTVHLDAAITQLTADGWHLDPDDLARLSPYIRRHLNIHGHYTFRPADPTTGPRTLRDPTEPDD